MGLAGCLKRSLRWLMISRLILFDSEERVIGEPLIALRSYGLVPELALALRNKKARTMRGGGGGGRGETLRICE
jgi:hypothetical protein